MGYEWKPKLRTELCDTYIIATKLVNEICGEYEKGGEAVRSANPVSSCLIADRDTGKLKTKWLVQIWHGKEIWKK
jgi:hypothetical protein